jgi:hypothetical protein
MSFRNRLLLGMALIMAAFIAAIAVSYSGLRATASQFGTFIDGVGALNQNYREMYAQGLQMGQALRNIVLDPENKQAYGNLTTAQAQFGKSQDSLGQLAAGSALADATRGLGGMRDKLAAQQQAVLALVKTDTSAAPC